MRWISILSLALITGLPGCASSRSSAPAGEPALAVTPPRMNRRAVARAAQEPPGEQVQIRDQGATYTLFIPQSWRPQNGQTELAIHFHGAPWFAIQEHVRARRPTPLLAIYLGEGSSVYRAPFEDPARLPRILELVSGPLRLRGGSVRITSLDISSYSAGYGAVREVVKSPQNVKLIRRLVLADSMYASHGPDKNPEDSHISPWIPIAQAARRGEMTFLLTYSQVPTSAYASSSECAHALCIRLGVPVRRVVGASTQPAAAVGDFPLLERADQGHFHAWGYGGADADAHMAHPRHLAELWAALDASRTR